MNKSARLHALLAFGFGCVFSGVLAYAGLRDKPITDPGQFFFLQVISSLSAAGIAAIIPGMLDLRLSASNLMVIRGTGALGIFVLVFSVNPPQLLNSQLETKIQSMYSNYGQGLYIDAEHVANEVLRLSPKEHRALNIKGGVAFYNRRFDAAVEYFTQCTELQPNFRVYWTNLGDALVEKGAPRKALEVYHRVNNGTPDWYFAVGRAYFHAGDYNNARVNLEAVSDVTLRGAARIIEAAAMLKLAESYSETERAAAKQAAVEKLQLGLRMDRNYWDGIFTNTAIDIHLSFDLPVKTLRELYETVSRPAIRSAEAGPEARKSRE